MALDIRMLENALVLGGSSLPSILGPGLSKVEIITKFERINLSVPDSLVQLYEWRNGIDLNKSTEFPDVDGNLFPLGRFYSLDVNLTDYEYYWSNGYWDRFLFPIFSSGKSEFFLINCDKKTEDFGMLFYFSTTDYLALSPITIFDSIENLIRGVVECYDRQVYVYDSPNNYLIVTNSEEEVKIHKRHNPKSLYWNNLQ